MTQWSVRGSLQEGLFKTSYVTSKENGISIGSMKRLYYLTTTSVVLFALADLASSAPATQELTGANYREWMKHIRPSAEEGKWREISWRNKLMPAVNEAQKLNRPVLLWAMNGNPCGET